MNPSSLVKLKHVAWASGGLLAAILVVVVAHSGAKPTVQPPPPVVEVAQVGQRDVPVYGEWIGRDFLWQGKRTNQAVTSKALQMQRYLPPSTTLTWIQALKTVLAATAPPVESASA